MRSTFGLDGSLQDKSVPTLASAAAVAACAAALASPKSFSATSTSFFASSSFSLVQRRKSNLKANLESSLSYFSFEHLVPGAVNLGLIGSSCTA
jgi:hypothetical protein